MAKAAWSACRARSTSQASLRFASSSEPSVGTRPADKDFAAANAPVRPSARSRQAALNVKASTSSPPWAGASVSGRGPFLTDFRIRVTSPRGLCYEEASAGVGVFYDRAPIDSPGRLLTERRPPFLLARPNLAPRMEKGRVGRSG